MSSSFHFTLGKPADNESGRWVEGTVTDREGAYEFAANLWFRSGSTYGCQRICLNIARPFATADFETFLNVVSTGQFETASRTLELSEDIGQHYAAGSSSLEGTLDNPSATLREDLLALTEKLKEARKRQMLGMAFARLSHRRDHQS